jgi:hypothetical protein
MTEDGRKTDDGGRRSEIRNKDKGKRKECKLEVGSQRSMAGKRV